LADRSFDGGADENVAQHLPPVRPHDHEIGADLIGDIGDRLERLADRKTNFARHAIGAVHRARKLAQESGSLSLFGLAQANGWSLSTTFTRTISADACRASSVARRNARSERVDKSVATSIRPIILSNPSFRLRSRTMR
jgi:hypothetical protein